MNYEGQSNELKDIKELNYIKQNSDIKLFRDNKNRLIGVYITDEMIDKAYDFSEKIIKSNNQYSRMMQTGITNSADKDKIRINRTFVGKLGELCFFEFLKAKGVYVDIDGMFDIFEGQTNVDEYDLKLPNGKTIEIKSAVFKNHNNLVVPIDQFNNMPKSFYVGVKFECPLQGNNYMFIEKNTFKKATIEGFCTYDDLAKNKTINLGEFDCKARRFEYLTDIQKLVDMFE